MRPRSIRDGARAALRARPPAGGAAGALLFALLALLPAGCGNWTQVRPDPARTLGAIGDKPLVVPAAIEPDRRERYVTSLERIEARAGNSDLVVWHSLPGTSDWRLAERTGRGSFVAIDLSREGVHLLSTAPEGGLPYYSSVEIAVDRAPPSLEVRFERMARSSQAGSHFRLRWRAEDPHMRLDSVRIEWRDPALGTWTAVAERMKPSGALLWPYPIGTPADHRLRIVAVDIGGNEASIEIELARAFERPVWRAGESAGAATPPPAAEGAPPAEGAPAPSSPAVGGSASALVPAGAGDPIPVATIAWPVAAGERVAGGARLPAPVRGPVHLLAPDGTSRLLEREGNLIALPRESGAPYRLVAGGDRSPEFALDSVPPVLAVEGVRPGADAVTVAWGIADPAEPGGVRALLRIEAESGMLPPVELVASPQRVPLAAGAYVLRIEARDALGNAAESDPYPVQVGEMPPSVAELAGATIAGGRSRYLLLAPGAAVGEVELRARPVGGGEPLAIAVTPATNRLVLWDVPPVDGEYELEIAWRGADGSPRLRRVTPPFAIDSTPPECEVRLATTAARDALSAIIRGEAGIVVAGLYRRADPQAPWETIAEGWSAHPVEAEGAGGSGTIRLDLALGAFVEGAWQLGVSIRDARGILVTEPVAFPPVVVDRTPPAWRTPPAFPVAADEGEPPAAVLRLAEVPAQTAATWSDAAGERALALEAVADAEGATLRLPALPPGEGTLRVRASDAAGNETTLAGTVAVRPALLAPVAMLPAGTVVPPGDEVFIEIAPDPAHAGVGAAELRLVDAAGRALSRWPLSDGRRVAATTPAAPGRYRFEVGPPGAEAYRGGRIDFAVDPAADPEARLRELVLAVRDWEERRAGEVRGSGDRGGARREVEAERRALVADLEGELARDPRSERTRRALARLHLRADPPRNDLAAAVLEEGLRQPVPAPERAALLNDLAVLILDGDPGRARDLLRQAIDLEPTAGRYQNLGDVALRLGRVEEATIEYAAAFELDPRTEASRERFAHAAARLAPERRERVRRTISLWLDRGLIDRADADELWRTATGGEASAW